MQNGFEVEWIVDIPYDKEMETHIFDAADTRCQDFAKLEDAIAFGKTKIEADWFGAPQVREFVLDEWKQKDYVGDAIEVFA